MITKLVIGVTDKDRNPGSGGFTCMINPETISYSRETQIKEESGANTAGTSNQFAGITNESMSFDLYLDGTGVAGPLSVDAQLASLVGTVYTYQGGIHRVNYLKITYGSIEFFCQLQSMKTDYTLFSSSGSPLRAKVSLSFKEYCPQKEKEAEAKKQSPDMTHVKTVREGDSLLAMCREIYGKMDYYLQVAEINGLSNFRELEVGSQLVFPPLQK